MNTSILKQIVTESRRFSSLRAMTQPTLRQTKKLFSKRARIKASFSSWMLLALLLSTSAVRAADFTYSISGGQATITGYTGAGGAVTIPDSIDQWPVISIGQDAFNECKIVSAITLPNSVKTIEKRAFYHCHGLTTITIPGSVTSIEDIAFMGCYKLSKITIAEGLESIGSYVFYDCIKLSSVTLPGSVVTMGDQVFWNCTGLRKIYFKGNAPSIGADVFHGDSSLTVYYYAGATGWGSTFGGRPTAALGPVIDSTKPVLAIRSPINGLCVSNTFYALTAAGTAKDNLAVSNVYYRITNSAGIGSWASASSANGWASWTAPLTPAPGANVLQAYAMDTSGNVSPTTTVRFVFVPLTALSVANTGLGILKPAWTNGQLLALGSAYTVTAAGTAGYVFSNWSGNLVSDASARTNVLRFIMKSNAVLSANFVSNPFDAVAGEYRGLFLDESSMTPASVGAFAASVKNNGVFTAKLLQGAASYPLSGRLQFDLAGLATNTVTVNRTNLTVVLRLVSSNHGEIQGFVISPTWTALLSSERNPYSKTHPAPQGQKKYTLGIEGGSDAAAAPSGYGYGSVKVDTLGNLNFSGVLGDGTKVSQNTMLCGADNWPLYVSLYAGKGFAIGWLTFSNSPSSDFTGALSWIKQPSPGLKPYANGFDFTNGVAVTGSVYSFTNNTVLSWTNGLIELNGGNLSTGITNYLTIDAKNKISGSNKLSLTFTPGTGLFKGAVLNANTGKSVPVNGAVLQKLQSGFGTFLGTNQSGSVELSPR